MALTQHRPISAFAGRRFGSFAGKTPDAGSGHPVGKIIQHRPIAAFAGKRYGSFAGKASTAPVFWDFAAPNELALTGVLGVSGDIGFIGGASLFNLSQTSALAIAGALSASGDVAYVLPFNLAQTADIGLSGVVGLTGDIAAEQQFDLSPTGPIAVIVGTLGITGDIALQAAPVDLSTPLRVFTMALSPSGRMMQLVYRDGAVYAVNTGVGRQRLTLLSGAFVGKALNEFGEVYTLL